METTDWYVLTVIVVVAVAFVSIALINVRARRLHNERIDRLVESSKLKCDHREWDMDRVTRDIVCRKCGKNARVLVFKNLGKQ